MCSSDLADEYLMGSVVPRHIAFWAKAEYFNGSGLSGWAMKTLMNSLGAIEVNRDGGRAALTALDAAIPALRGGDLVGVYPEGTRSTDGYARRFRMGASLLCRELGVPAVPMVLRGTYQAMPRGGFWPKKGRPVVSVRYGRPLEPGEDESTSAFNARQIGRAHV